MTSSERLNAEETISEKLRALYLGKRIPALEFISLVNELLSLGSEIKGYDAYYNHRGLKRIRCEGFPLSIAMKNGSMRLAWVEPSAEEHANYDFKIGLQDGSERYIDRRTRSDRRGISTPSCFSI